MTATSVLVVDDDDDVRDVITACLCKAGYTVQTASNGQEALDQLRAAAEPPALVVMDLMMPVMDGWALLARLREAEPLSRIPVIVMSAGGGLALGSVSAAAQLSKPVDPDALMALVAELAPRPA